MNNLKQIALVPALASLLHTGVFASANRGADAPPKTRIELKPSAFAQQYDLLIYGLIGDYWYGSCVVAQDIVQQLIELPAGISQINVRINSDGGSMWDGIAIYNELVAHPARVEVWVDGVAASIASLIAMAGDAVHMPATTRMMIHAPWGGIAGNAMELREVADILDGFSESMAIAYANKSGMPIADVQALLKDGKDHYYSADQAVAAGFADDVVAGTGVVAPAETDETEELPVAAAGGLIHFTRSQSASVHAVLAAARTATHASATRTDANPADSATSGENDMLRKVKGRLVSLSPKARATSIDNGGPAGGGGGGGAVNAADIQAAAKASLRERNIAIKAALKPVLNIAGVRELQDEALSDVDMTLDQVNAKALALAGAQASPSSGGSAAAGADQVDKTMAAMSDWIVARAMAKGETGKLAVANAAPDNPYRGMSLSAMAEHCVQAAGHNTTRMTRNEIAALALRRPQAAAGQTTSDFPTLLGNTINRILVATYTTANTKWMTFCKIGDLNDFRPNQRLRMGTFADLLPVNEAGNYEQASLSDATAETIKASRKGRKIIISREMIVNDDLQAFADMSTQMGNAAARTVEKDVFVLLALNAGLGPVMSDGNTLFHAAHGNIGTTPAAPSVTSFDATRQQMSAQQDNSGNDYLDIQPSVWLGPNSLYGQAQLLNINETDPSVSNKFQIQNIVKAMLDKVVGTPRLSGTAWYIFANPDQEPVIEVGFVDGQRTPRTDSEIDFDSDGVKYKVVHEYGVAATGWKGANRNAGA